MAATQSPSPAARRFPRWAKVLLAVVVVLLVIALALPYFLNVDRYRDTIAEAIQKATGRRVTLGKIRAQFNPQGFPDGDLITADEIRGNVALGPLLHGIVHLNSLDLVRPKVALITDESGKDNYTFSAPVSAQKSPSGARASRAGGPASTAASSSISLDQIDSFGLTGAELSLGGITRGKVVSSADVKGLSLTLHNFVLSPANVRNWQAESKLSGVTLALNGWTAPIAFSSGQITLSGGKLDAQFVADLAKAADIKGTFSVPDIQHVQVNFEMSASTLNLDTLVATAGGAPGGPAPAASKPAADPPAGPSELVARGHINIEKITTKPYTVGPANAEMRIYTDRAEMPVTLGMYGGTLQITSRVDRVTTPARFSANVQMRSLNVAKVLDVSPAARGKMSGTGELDLQLLGSMSDAWRKTLSGKGKFAVRDGHLPGVNLGSAAQSLAKFAGVGGDTQFSVLEGDINIAKELVSSEQVHLDSTSGTVDLRGSLGLDGTLDYQGQVALTPGSGGSGGGNVLGGVVGGLLGSRVGKIVVPIALGGTIESPKVTPGKGVPSFTTPTTASGAAPSAAPAAQPAAPQNPINALKDLFKKR
jgi:AsmA protein